jgi:uncharacterized membrane protein
MIFTLCLKTYSNTFYSTLLNSSFLPVASGIGMAIQEKIPLLELNWLTVSLKLFALTGVIWLAILIPLQRRMIHYSGQCIESGNISKDYLQASRYWAIFGIAATVLPMVIMYL